MYKTVDELNFNNEHKFTDKTIDKLPEMPEKFISFISKKHKIDLIQLTKPCDEQLLKIGSTERLLDTSTV